MKRLKTLSEYLEAAVGTARFEKIENGTRLYAEIPGFLGVWAEGNSRSAVIEELRGVLKGWIELQLERGDELPEVNGARPEQLVFA